jgi:PEP-CTERM motif
MNRAIRLVVCSCVLWTLAAANVAADPVRITDGFLTAAMGSPGSGLAITGTRGFTAVAGVLPTEGNVEAFTFCTPCDPGTTIGVGATLGQSAFDGTVTLDGQSYELTQSINDDTVLSLEITATATTPLSASSMALVKAPFTMKGMFFPGAGMAAVPLIGRGVASVLFRGSGSGPDIRSRLLAADDPFVWSASLAHYEFQDATATPEPATLTLMGLGALVAGRRKLTLRAVRPRWSRV